MYTILSPSLMQMGKCWAFIGRPTYQMIIIIKKSFILRLATQVSRSGILVMLRLGLASVGINGSLKQRAVLHWMGLNSLFIQQPSVQSRFWYRQLWPLATYHARTRSSKYCSSHRSQSLWIRGSHPSEENGGQSSSLDFYGSSFITDETGAILEQAERQGEAVLLATYDLDKEHANA